MVIKIPSTDKKFSQPNQGDILGNIWSTFNIDLQDNPGSIRASKRLKLVTKTGDSGASSLGVPVGFKFFDGFVFTVAGSSVYKNSSQDLNSAFSIDTSTNTPTGCSSDFSDIENFNDSLLVTNNQKLFSKVYNGSGTGDWTDRTGSLSLNSSANHIIRYFKKFERAYVTDYFSIQSIDTTWATNIPGNDYAVQIPLFTTPLNTTPIFKISCMEVASDRIWIGIIKNVTSGGTIVSEADNFEASVFEWDGISNKVTKEYPIEGASGVMSIKIQNDIPIIMDSNGIMRKYDGQGFKEIGRLPVNPNSYLGFPTDIAMSNRFTHPNGMIVTQENTILIAICNRNTYLFGTTESIEEQLPSGIWECTQDNSMTHKHSFSYMPIGSSTVTDYGQNRISRVGGIANLKVFSTTGIINTIIAGCEFYTDATTIKSGIFSVAPTPDTNPTYPGGQKFAYFVTPFLQSSQAMDAWKKAFVMYRQFLDSGDKVILKYRYTKGIPLEISITWVTTTTFTTSTDISALVGYEVEIVQGTGSGKCSHITSVVNNSGTYTVTVDEIYTGVGISTAKARIQNWIKSGYVTDQISEIHTFVIGQNKPRMQVKVCMQFTGDDEILNLIIANSPFEWIDNAGK